MPRITFAVRLSFILFAIVSTVFGQNTARVTGTVVDPTGAAVAGAKIALTSDSTGAQIDVETNGIGSFNISQIDSGSYSIQVAAAGFKIGKVEGIKVDVGKEYSLPPIRLEVGGVSESVTVEAGVNLVQTTNSEVSSTLYVEQLKSLPLKSRNPLNLIGLQAGAGSNGLGPTVVNGTRSSFSNMTQDGINIQDNLIRSNGLDFSPNMPFLGQVGEMTITTQNSDVSSGGGSSQISLATPSGSNQYHGEALWYNRVTALAANDFFNNATGVKRQTLLLNQYGANLGGPIHRNKAFFYGFYEAFRLRQQVPSAGFVLLPQARNGIYTYLDSTGARRQLDVMQAARLPIDPKIRDLLNRIPTTVNFPTIGDGRNTGGYLFSQRANRTRDNFGSRLDYQYNEKHVISGTYLWNRDSIDRPDFDATFHTVPTVLNDDTGNLLSLGLRSTLTPRLTNELRAGFNRTFVAFKSREDFSQPILVNFIFTDPINSSRAEGRNTNTYNLRDNASWQRGNHVFRFGWDSQLVRVRTFADDGISPIYVIGFSIGDARTLQANQFPGGIGGLDLANANAMVASLAGVVGSAQQTFNVTGKKSGYVPGASAVRNLSLNNLSFFGTDQWRLTRRLTANLGLRWEYMGRYDERDGLALAPVVKNNDVLKTLLSNATVDFAGSHNGRPFYGKDLNNFAPNVGLAWDPWGNGKSAVRLGYSVHFVNDEQILAADNAVRTNPGLSTTVVFNRLIQSVGSLPSIPAPPLQIPTTFADQLDNDPGAPGFAVDPHLATPYLQEWNVSLQRELPGRTSLEVRYVGNKGTKLYRGVDYNQVDIRSNGFLDDFLRARNNGFLALARNGSFNPAFNANIPGSQQLRVFPRLGLGGVLTSSTVQSLIQSGEAGQLASLYFLNGLEGDVSLLPNPNIFVADLLGNFSNSTYHALQVELKRNLKTGLLLEANYTWSKVLTDSPALSQFRFDAYLDINNPKLERARADYDIPQSFKTNLVYDLPVGGTHRLSFSNRSWDKLLNGWKVGSIFIWQSGVPFSVVSGRGTLNRTGRSTFNTATTQLSAGELKSKVGVHEKNGVLYFIDPSVLGKDGRAVSPDGTAPFSGQIFYNPNPGESGSLERRMFNGPAYFNWDFSVIKQTPLREGVKLEVRVETFNLPNHAVFFPGSPLIGLGVLNNINSVNFGRITTTANSARSLQTAVRILF